MEIKTDQLTKLLREQIEKFDGSIDVAEVGEVIQVGDGVADTVFTVGVDTYTVDGIRTPRSTKNFPNGEADLWDPTGVGALWDQFNPTLFPDPLL